MSKRHDNTSRASEFICLRCLSKNQVGDKIRRPNMRENYPEIDITVDASCCACVTPDTHKAALATMKMCQIEVIGENNEL